MAIVDPNISIGSMTSPVGWKNGGTVAATTGRRQPLLAKTVPPDPNCTTVAVTLRWVQRQPSALAAAGDRSKNAPVAGCVSCWILRVVAVRRRHAAAQYHRRLTNEP